MNPTPLIAYWPMSVGQVHAMRALVPHLVHWLTTRTPKTMSTLRAKANDPETVTLVIHTRIYGDTYFARCNGKSASCTSSEEEAAKRAAMKAAAQLVEMGIVSRVPDRDELTVERVTHGIFHSHLGPCALPGK